MILRENVNVNRAEQLQFLRFVAFALIFLWHVNAWAFDFFPGGNGAAEAVSFFFILSGLVTGYSSYGKDNSVSIRGVVSYVWKKVKRVYPLYFITTIFTVAYSGIPIHIAYHEFGSIKENMIQLIKNLLLIQSWFPSNYFSFNGVGWFLSSLMFLYIISIPLSVLLSRINKNKYRYIIFAILFIILWVSVTIYCYLIRDMNMEFWAYVFPPSRVPEYALGMILGYVIRALIVKVPDNRMMKVGFTCLEILCLVIWLYALYCPVISWQYRIVHWLFPNMLLLCTFTFGKGYISTCFRTKSLKLLGDISFELYLLHQIVITVYMTMSGMGAISKLGNLFSIMFCMCITIVLGYLISNKSKNNV